MDIREDAWLSGVFGHPVYAVAATGAANVERHAAGRTRALYYAKVPVEHTDDVRSFAAVGFSVVDVNVTLTRDAAPAGGPSARDVTPLQRGEEDAVLDIAGTCFRYSRFHLDPLVPRATANDVKREWIASYMAGRRGVELLVARDGGAPAGFLAVLDDDGTRVIDLVGVDPERQGRGVGAALVSAFVERHGPNARELRVGTQIANVPSLRLYARFGFEVARSDYVLHRHVGATT